MKSLFFIFLFSLSNAYALEIQCDSDLEQIDVVFKTSNQTNTTYLLFFNENSVVKHWALEKQLVENDYLSFSYEDTETKIFIDKQKRQGKIISQTALLEDKRNFYLRNCESFEK